MDNTIKISKFAADFRKSEMSNKPAQTFILVALVTILLLAMHFLPQLTLWDRPLRAVNILNDVIPEVYNNETKPLIDYYEKAGNISHIDGTTGLENVFNTITGILGE